MGQAILVWHKCPQAVGKIYRALSALWLKLHAMHAMPWAHVFIEHLGLYQHV
jgi:hypothetical protein